MNIHKLAEYFPLLEGEEFELLKQDIKDNGQLEPIVTFNGEIIDGVNRYRAIQELNREGKGIEPDYVPLEDDGSAWGNDPLKYVISANIRRRHLNESQLSIIQSELNPIVAKRVMEAGAEKVAEEFGVQLPGVDRGNPTDAISGAVFGVSRASATRAKRVKEQAPERIPDIMAGKTTVRQVDTELREARAREKATVRDGKVEQKERQETPREVGVYMDALKHFKRDLQTAIKVAEYGKFSPEATRFSVRRHEEIRALFSELEVVFDGQEKEAN